MSSRLILFLVNRRFFNEASTLFYSDNTFKFFSAYVSRGQDPFGCNLTRIRKCFLHLTGTRVYAEPFLFWYVKEFAAALVPHHSLEYLLLRVLLHQLPQLSPLEKLHGIKFVQVATVLWSDTGYWSALRYPKWWSLDFPHWPEPPEQRHVQRLERLVMSDGSPSSELSIRCRSAEAAVSNKAYVADPALSLHLSGDALLHAQTHGGWADGSALYGFLGVDSSKRLGRRHR